MAFMPQKISAQYKIKCDSPTTCDGWLYHNNKIGIGTGWGGEAYIPRTTLHLHEFNSANTFINITNQTTGFPQGSQTLGMFIGMMGNKAMISNFQNDNLVLATGTNERLVVTSTGNTGVGISTPQNVLHLHKSIGTIPQLAGNESTENKSLTATTVYGLQITNRSTGSAATNGLLVGLAANGSARIVQQGALSLSLGVNNADVVNINSSGNVGIGTTNPTAKLHTNGTIRIENLPNITAYTNEKILLLDAQGNVKQASANLIGDNLGNHTASQNIKLNDKWISNDADNEGIKISNQGDVYISGSLGVGVATPQAKIHIASNNTPDKQVLYVGNNLQQGEGLAFYNTCDNEHGWIRGEMGFGYKPTSTSWEVTAQYNYGGIRFGSNGIRFIAGTPADGTTPKEAAVITNNGNVGIGIQQPLSKLHVYESSNNPATVMVENNSGNVKIGVDGVHAIINSGQDLMINYNTNANVTVGGEQSGNFTTLHNTFLAMNNGKVGIGTVTPRELLTVKGKILSEENIVVLDANISNYPDYVFLDNYKLLKIDEVEKYIKVNKHLPEIPTIENVKNEGIKLAEMNMLLLKKIEELYLYIIELKKEIENLKTN